MVKLLLASVGPVDAVQPSGRLVEVQQFEHFLLLMRQNTVPQLHQQTFLGRIRSFCVVNFAKPASDSVASAELFINGFLHLLPHDDMNY